MGLLLKGGEFIATEALSATVLTGLMNLARRRPLLLNGVEFSADDFARLAEEAHTAGRPVWPRSSTEAHKKQAIS